MPALGTEETFNLSAARPPPDSRRTVNKLYPQLELDDTIDQLQSAGGGGAASQTTRVIPPASAGSHTLKHSPQDR